MCSPRPTPHEPSNYQFGDSVSELDVYSRSDVADEAARRRRLRLRRSRRIQRCAWLNFNSLLHGLAATLVIGSVSILAYLGFADGRPTVPSQCTALLDFELATEWCALQGMVATETWMMYLVLDDGRAVLLVILLAIVAVTYVVFCLVHLRDSSRLSVYMARAQIANKIALVSLAALILAPWCRLGSAGTWAVVACFSIYAFLTAVYSYAFLTALYKRIEFMAVSLQSDMQCSSLRKIRVLGTALSFVWASLQIFNFFPCRGHLASPIANLCIFVPLSVCYGAFAVASARAMTEVKNSLKVLPTAESVSDCPAHLAAEAAWAQKVLTRARFDVVLPPSITSFSLICTSAIGIATLGKEQVQAHERFRLAYLIHSTLASMVDVVCFYMLSGGCHAERPRVEAPRWKPLLESPQVDVESAWGAKVDDLAKRSIDVAALLDFFSKLGPGGVVMPHFDPRRSTTNDVVRQAVIPLSQVGEYGAAYATVINSATEYPDTMVTHCWSNLFLNLVAAIIADVLGHDEYRVVASHLAARRLSQLRTAVAAAGKSHRRYWVCAFCVNQHANICGGFPLEPPGGTAAHEAWDVQRRDNVTGAVFQVCTCHERKHFNDHPDECELNKFDDMMVHLAAQVPHLSQLVATDAEFQLFSRAWCVAELLEASQHGIPQRVQLPSRRELDVDADDLSTYIKLSILTVVDCEASRPEDREAILAKIPDVHCFDSQLQCLIFGARGLLSKYFIGFGVLEAAVGTARRAKLVAAIAEQGKRWESYN